MDCKSFDAGVNEAMISTMRYDMQIVYSPTSYEAGSAALESLSLFYGYGACGWSVGTLH